MKIVVAIILLGAMPLGFADGKPIVVKAVPFKQLVIKTEASAPATVMSLGDSRIGAELNARIKEIPARVGDIVEPGGVLVRLDCGDYELAVAELEAMLAGTEARISFAEAQLRRVQSLKVKRTVSEELLDQRKSELAGLVAERDRQSAQLGKARRNVAKCTLQAPFQAAVVERLASVGEYAMPGSPLIRVLDVSRLEVSANVIIRDAEALLHAKEIVFRHGDQDFPMAVRALAPLIDTATRTREVRLLFAGRMALPGATGRLVWSNGPALPADLLVSRERRLGVLLVEDGTARFHPVPGAREGRPAAVDLPPDTLIITDGRFALQNGAAIQVVN